jgi:hypothetical protein
MPDQEAEARRLERIRKDLAHGRSLNIGDTGFLLLALAKAEQERDSVHEDMDAYRTERDWLDARLTASEARERELREALEWIADHSTDRKASFQAHTSLQATQEDG